MTALTTKELHGLPQHASKAIREKTAGTLGTVADNATTPGALVAHVVAVPDGATGDVDVVVAEKVEVLDVTVVKTASAGGASDTVQVKNAADAISNAISINIADQTTARAGTINDATSVINAGGTLRVTRTKASGANAACRVIVHCLRRA
jgi:hypothetical protein